jgi:cell wall-associated NlpC family hydrolase
MDGVRSSRHAARALVLGLSVVLAGCAADPAGAPQHAAPVATASTPGSPTSSSASPTHRSPSRSASARPTPGATHRGSATPTPVPRPAVPLVRYVTRVPLPKGCLTVSPAIVGVKVYLAQRALHLVGHKERYDAATVAAVRAFQAAHHLPVTGTVTATTWAALGTGYPFCVDRYTQQPTVGAGATAHQRIEAMIAYAQARLGLPYVWGGAGPVGFDCSGLVIQALYAGGVVVPGLNTDLHVQADFRSTHALYASQLPHVPLGDRQRGDLVFYGYPITHMAIYLGGGRILEAVRPVLRTASLYADGLPAQPYVVRPFPG